jgi:NAD(P)-dependent dehydrogenase (short-subunit alcohol dehydrogenase family)
VFNLSAEEVSRLLSVHVMGHFNTVRHAGQHWRARSKAGEELSARLINTSSASGVFGNFGQTGYGAAKAAIAALTQISSLELARYGVTVNAVCPTARTRLTTAGSRTIAEGEPQQAVGWDPLDPANIAPMVVFLASEAAKPITGQVFGVFGGLVQVYEGWRPGTKIESAEGPFTVSELADRWTTLFGESSPKWESRMEEVSVDVRAALAAAGLSS